MENVKTMDSVRTKTESVQEECLQILEEIQQIIPELKNLLDTIGRTGYRSRPDFGINLSERIGIQKIKRYYQKQYDNCQRSKDALTRISNSRPLGKLSAKEDGLLSEGNSFAREYLFHLWWQLRLEKKMMGWVSSENDKDIDPVIPIIVGTWRDVLLVNEYYRPEVVVMAIGKRIVAMPEESLERDSLCQMFYDELHRLDLLTQKIHMRKMPIVH